MAFYNRLGATEDKKGHYIY